MIVNDDTSKFNDVFLLNISSSILSISFFLRIESYEETIHRKFETIIDININDDDSQFMLETKEKNRRIVSERKELCVCVLISSKRK
jgi:hypothetical protein